MLSILFIIEATQILELPMISERNNLYSVSLSLWKEFMQLSKANNLDPEESLHTERIWSEIEVFLETSFSGTVEY